MDDVDPRELKLLYEAEKHIERTDEADTQGLHRDGQFIRRGQVESMRYYRVAGDGGKSLVHCEVTIGTMFETLSVRVMNEDAIAPFKVGGRVELSIRSVGDETG